MLSEYTRHVEPAAKFNGGNCIFGGRYLENEGRVSEKSDSFKKAFWFLSAAHLKWKGNCYYCWKNSYILDVIFHSAFKMWQRDCQIIKTKCKDWFASIKNPLVEQSVKKFRLVFSGRRCYWPAAENKRTRRWRSSGRCSMMLKWGPPGGVTARSSADETLAGLPGLPLKDREKKNESCQNTHTKPLRDISWLQLHFYRLTMTRKQLDAFRHIDVVIMTC